MSASSEASSQGLVTALCDAYQRRSCRLGMTRPSIKRSPLTRRSDPAGARTRRWTTPAAPRLRGLPPLSHSRAATPLCHRAGSIPGRTAPAPGRRCLAPDPPWKPRPEPCRRDRATPAARGEARQRSLRAWRGWRRTPLCRYGSRGQEQQWPLRGGTQGEQMSEDIKCGLDAVVIEDGEALADDLHVLPRHRLLPQPHGFERFFRGREHLHALDESLGEGADGAEAQLDPGVSAPEAPPLANDRDHAVVACIHQVFDVEVPFVVRLCPPSKEPHVPVAAPVLVLIRPALEGPHVPHEVRRGESPDRGGAMSGLELAKLGGHHLHVLARHRPPSIPPRRRSRKGGPKPLARGELYPPAHASGRPSQPLGTCPRTPPFPQSDRLPATSAAEWPARFCADRRSMPPGRSPRPRPRRSSSGPACRTPESRRHAPAALRARQPGRPPASRPESARRPCPWCSW